MSLSPDIHRILEENSRTFFIPISRLPERLQEAIACAYLCMRAIDEIEDHPVLKLEEKSSLLNHLGFILQAHVVNQNQQGFFSALDTLFLSHRSVLPQVSLRIGEWLWHSPLQIAPRIWDATIAMAERMAFWAARGWRIQTEADLDAYTFSVAGAVGLLICDIWNWFDGSAIDRTCAVQFGRGLQAVNILRNHTEDLQRGVDFFPSHWKETQMFAYAHRNLDLARSGVNSMPGNSFKYFVEIPLRLAEATLEAIHSGSGKLTRQQVLEIVAQVR